VVAGEEGTPIGASSPTRPPRETDGRSQTRSADRARKMRGTALGANWRPPLPRPGAKRDAAGHALVTWNGHARDRLVPTVARAGAICVSDRRVEETTGEKRKSVSLSRLVGVRLDRRRARPDHRRRAGVDRLSAQSPSDSARRVSGPRSSPSGTGQPGSPPRSSTSSPRPSRLRGLRGLREQRARCSLHTVAHSREGRV
jgi:hypothetical protein